MEQHTTFFIRYLPMKISLISMETALLPEYLGSTLRGAIGQALHYHTIAFDYLYNNRTLSDNGQDIINPYVIVPPAIKQTPYHAGEELSFYIFLLGEAAQYAQPLVNALHGVQRLELGASRYPFELKKVTHSLDQRVIWQAGLFNAAAARSAILPYRSLSGIRKLNICVHTPLRIRRNGALLETVDFPTIIRNITHRVEAIAARYGEYEMYARAIAKYYLPGTSIKGALCQGTSVRVGFMADDVPIHNDCIVLRNLYKAQYLKDEQKACFDVFFENVGVEMIKDNVELTGEFYLNDRETAEELLKAANKSTRVKINQMLGYLQMLKESKSLPEFHTAIENLSPLLDANDIFLFGGYKGLLHSMELRDSQQEIAGAVFLDHQTMLPHGLAKIELT